MTTTRGFVDRIEVGRAGLARIRLLSVTGRSEYVVSDLDADPERFNERLSKVAIARDAMNRSDPVEIEWAEGDAGNEIDRIARISRDQLDPPGNVETRGGLVVRVVLQAHNAIQSEGDVHDEARVYLLTTTGEAAVLRLDMQIPERAVACEQLDMIRDAQASGQLAQFLVSTEEEQVPTIIAVWSGPGADRPDEADHTVSGFVESLGVILPAGADALDGSLALARITTAPEFTGVGGTVDLTPFEPQALEAFVARGSVPYTLLEAGLRDNTRVRVRYHVAKAQAAERPEGGDGENTAREEGSTPPANGEEGTVRFRTADVEAALLKQYRSQASHDAEHSGALPGLITGAELLAPLASASRPVWLHIDREMLDRGPDGAEDCPPGLPTSSLQQCSLRDLRIPYRAEWKGCGCFNHGVYRFEMTAPEGCTIDLDGKQLCVYDSGEEGVWIAYACLDGDHCVTVVIPHYVCDTEFDLDVYRIR
jgi:hypothetical protein